MWCVLTARYSGPPIAGDVVAGGLTDGFPMVSFTRVTVEATTRAGVLRGVPRVVPYTGRVFALPVTALVIWTPDVPSRWSRYPLVRVGGTIGTTPAGFPG